MFGSEGAPSRDFFGAEEAPERPAQVEKPAAAQPWRPGGARAERPAPAFGGEGASWRGGGNTDNNNNRERSPVGRPMEEKRERKERAIPQTQEELFQKQMDKARRAEQQAKAAKDKNEGTANTNAWAVLGGSKKKKKNKKKDGEGFDD